MVHCRVSFRSTDQSQIVCACALRKLIVFWREYFLMTFLSSGDFIAADTIFDCVYESCEVSVESNKKNFNNKNVCERDKRHIFGFYLFITDK